MRRVASIAAGAVMAVAAIACGGDSKVVRVYDGRIVEGAFVPPEAYAAYLKGVLAEEAGDLRSALTAYEQAAAEDDEDPEPFTRVGDLRCKLDPKNTSADEAFSRAVGIDKTYAPALEALARCVGARGKAGEAMAVLARIRPEDRSSTSMEALFVRLASQGDAAPSRNARERAIALTLASGEHPAAWDALITWGRSKSSGELLARGLEGLLRVAPMRSGEVEAGALELLGEGRSALARRVAASVADAPVELGITGVRDATVARLAIDEAILVGDSARAERRAIRGHVPLSEVAARALILERPDLAVALARAVHAADAGAGCARMVLAAVAAREAKPPPVADRGRATDLATDRPSAACVLVVAERLAAFGAADTARMWVGRVTAAPHGPGSTAGTAALAMAPHDPVIGPLAVDLAARGAISEAALPLELRLELAARRREPPPALDGALVDRTIVDAKHALLWHLLVDPSGSRAKHLLSRMHGAAEHDPIIGFSLARAALAASLGSPTPGTSALWAPVLRAIAASPADPLLLAAAVDVAKRGRSEDVSPARARLMAVARTPAERALATE